MSGKIKLLPDNVANQIAAGEVVTRPASVVKEMMENAVDAGSRNITVNFRDGGRELIQIIDDGEGMSPADARLAFDKHATSKINSLDDVYRLHTFGFRGEALASIAAIASVELVTRREEDELGVKILMEGSAFKSQEMTVAPKGSRFSVKNIFFNVPARRRQLDKSTTESRYITAEFQRVALCHPEVAFMLYNGDAPVYNLPVGTLKQRILGVIGRGMAANLLEVSTKTTIVSIEGFVGTPSSAKKSNEQFMFVNGRYFKSPYLHKAVMQAYEKLVPTGLQPSYFLYITVDPEAVDVNIHPQKTEVRFEDGPAVWQIMNASVRESLAKTGAVPMMDFEDEHEVEIPVFNARNVREIHIPASSANPSYNPFKADSSRVMGKAGMSDFMQSYGAERQDNATEPYKCLDSAMWVSEDDSVLDFIEGNDAVQTELEIEAGKTYILPLAGGYVATGIDGRLAVIDLHRAREVILYHRFMAMLESGHSASQTLMFPERMVFSHDDIMLLRDNRDDFTGVGFGYNILDDNTIELVSIPADMSMDDISDVLYDMIDGVRDETYNDKSQRKHRMATILSRRGGAEKFNESELEAIVETLRDCSNYSITADGRAVMSVIETEEIKRRFTK